MAARPRLGQEARRVRADRARRRLRRGRDAHDRASSRDGEWVINGSKIFITNAGTDITACVTITARTGDGRDLEHHRPERHAGLRDLGADGEARLARLRHARALVPGTRACPRRTCSARAARASGSSWRSSTAAGSRSRRWASASRRAPTTSRTRTRKERKQFGKPIAKFQAVQFKLADMATEIEAGRAARLQGGVAEGPGPRRSRKRPRWRSSTPASSRTAPRTRRCRSTAATASWTSTPISRLYRDQKILEIGEGTNEVQRMVIARHLGL